MTCGVLGIKWIAVIVGPRVGRYVEFCAIFLCGEVLRLRALSCIAFAAAPQSAPSFLVAFADIER